MPGALHGTTVLDLGRGAAAALATMLLAEHGARVLRVVPTPESVLRDGVLKVFDRGKDATAIDLSAALAALGEAGECPALAALDRLAAGADVLLHDLEPSSALQPLLDPVRLRVVNPALTTASVTAFGTHGPWRDDPPIDDLVLARTGVLGGMPGHRAAPVHLVHPLPSVGAGILAALGVAAALYRRARTGLPGVVETSLMDGALLYHPKVCAERLAPQVFQTHPSGSAPFYSVYPTGDGRWIQLGCVHAVFINAAADVLGIRDWLAAPRFGAGLEATTPEADAELRQRITTLLRADTLDAWMIRFEAADVPFAEARLTAAALDDPQIAHNRMAPTIDDPVFGGVRQMGVGLAMSHTPGALGAPRAASAERNHVPHDWPEATPAEAYTEREAGAEPAPPLAGLRVLEITNLIAGPTTTRLLADLGADVVKLEPPGGDMSRPIGRTYFYSVNLNKSSICIDTRTDDGRRLIHQLAAHSDALVANLRPGATERMGITMEACPTLVQTHLSGYGARGPYAHRPGIDPLAQALMGLERAQGGDDGAPVFPAQLAPTDFTTGALGAFGTVLALMHRDAGGPAQMVESNLLNAGALLAAQWFTDADDVTGGRPLADAQQFGLGPFHRLYRLADGWLYVAADEAAERERFLDWAALAPEARVLPVSANGEHPATGPLGRSIATALEGRSLAGALGELRASAVPAAPAESPASDVFLNCSHAVANGVVASCMHPTLGAMSGAWRYVRLDGTPGACRPTPLLGEQGAEVLEACGVAPGEVERLLGTGVLRVERHASSGD